MKDEMDELRCLSKLNENSVWISSEYEKIREKYAGKFIAVKDLSIIESDDNVSKLLARLHTENEDLDCISVEFVPPRGFMLIL